MKNVNDFDDFEGPSYGNGLDFSADGARNGSKKGAKIPPAGLGAGAWAGWGCIIGSGPRFRGLSENISDRYIKTARNGASWAFSGLAYTPGTPGWKIACRGLKTRFRGGICFRGILGGRSGPSKGPQAAPGRARIASAYTSKVSARIAARAKENRPQVGRLFYSAFMIQSR